MNESFKSALAISQPATPDPLLDPLVDKDIGSTTVHDTPLPSAKERDADGDRQEAIKKNDALRPLV